jgi:GDP-4-dehydro-6-deoxy-D-mannose reductase
MRVLVTGSAGFVGGHLTAALRERGHEVFETDHTATGDALAVDVTDPLAVNGAFELARPDAVAHLAAQAFVPASLEDPERTFRINAGGTQNVLDAARGMAIAGARPRVLVVSSAEVYGAQPADAYPLRETTAPRPANPYAASKVAAEALATAYARSFGVDAVVTRAFNHIGPGQDERFAVPAFASQLARITAGTAEPVVHVGNLTATRDILDVRDVCDAYIRILEGGGEAGEIYNVCRGEATPMREILRRLIELAHVPVEVREDPARMRPADVPVSVGDAAKLREATGWSARIPLAAALRAVYDDARARHPSAISESR